MAKGKLPGALKLVLVSEGGYVNNPSDPGGATNKGVTQAVYDAYRRQQGAPTRSVKQITDAELEAIYGDQYWRTIHGDELPEGVDYAVFDYAVNSGPGRAVKDLQRCLGVKVDGVVGLGTMTALTAADDTRLIADLCNRRLRFLKSLRTWKTFGRGWESRVNGVQLQALSIAAGTKVADAPVQAPIATAVAVAATAKAPEAQQAQLKTADGIGLTITAAGAGGEKVRQFAEQVQPHMGTDTVLGRMAFAVFTLLMLVGGCLIGYSYVKRIQEKGGLGGFVGSVFKGTTT